MSDTVNDTWLPSLKTDTPQAGEGVFSLVFLDSGDGWRIVHDHTSAK